jgi:signal transduction histidine kinase
MTDSLPVMDSVGVIGQSAGRKLADGSRIPRRILVVDDEKRMAQSLQKLLGQFGFEVTIVHSVAEGIASATTGDFPVVITDLRMPDGSGHDIVAAVGTRTNVAVIVITGHASTESAIQALHDHAFDYIRKPFEFEVLRATIERAFARLDADRFRDDMVSMITHDVKIPLTSILGYSSLIFNRETDELHPRAREFVQTIHANGVKVLSLLDNFLTTCKIEAGRLQLVMRPVAVVRIIKDLMDAFEFEFRRNDLAVEISFNQEQRFVQGDESLLYRALSNVISNACKYTPKGGRIAFAHDVVPGDYSPLGVESVLVRAANTGPGIAPEDLPFILERYTRSRLAGTIEGSGLGSYVLKTVVEAHGGAVRVESQPDILTTFSIFLPAAPCE